MERDIQKKEHINENNENNCNDNGNDNGNDNDNNVLSGDNKVDVEIEPDVKSNNVHIQLCSCSIILNCFTTKKE